MHPIILEAKNIKKRFGNIVALKNGTIRAYCGAVNIIMGENGAGKSTIMNIISGSFPPDSGTISFKNQIIKPKSIKALEKLGVVIVHQEIKLVEDLSIAENIFLGREIQNIFGIINYSKTYKAANKILNNLGLNLDSKQKVSELSIAQKQMVEIAKALSKKSSVIIFDEPTSSIGLEETQKLFEIIHNLKKQNIAILYITHRMSEIQLIGDYVTIFRDGEYIQESSIHEISETQIIELMVGRKLENQFFIKEKCLTKDLLKIQNLSSKYFKNINLKIKGGEILGVSGLIGAGRTELFKTITGYYQKTSGLISYKNKPIEINHPKQAIEKGFFYLSEDRKNEGLHLDKTISFNLSLSSLNKVAYWKSFLKLKTEKIINQKMSLKMNVKTDSISQNVENLSGGNQQKVAIGKALLAQPEIFIFDEPTRGVDVGARKEIYDKMLALKKLGKAVVVISSDMPEIIGLSDRYVVMHEGKITADTYKELTQNEIMKCSLGLGECFE